MEDRDPVVALQACIAAIRRNEVHDGSSVDRLHQCLRRVGDALREKDREIEWLREALEQRDSEQRSRESQLQWENYQTFEQSNGSAGVAGGGHSTQVTSESALPNYWQGTRMMAEGGGPAGGMSVVQDQGANSGGPELEPGHDRMTEPVSEYMAMPDQTSHVSTEMMRYTSAPDSLKQEPLHATTEGRFGGWRWQTDVVEW